MGRLEETRTAVDLVSSYLPTDMETRLRASYDFSLLAAHEKTATTHFIDPTEFIGQPKKKAVPASKSKKIKTTGMAPMTSFFAPKPKRQKT
ncbi:MAG: hypothetical protein EOO77_03590 [Oxalobacteraceae bacterium]|nr:MAG: hypothetical protein EOO77_03590 [Oxalobacteraceae bacterium]